MLNFNAIPQFYKDKNINLNTSHVKLQLARPSVKSKIIDNLNTSHVKLQLGERVDLEKLDRNLNTSHVKLQLNANNGMVLSINI